MALPKKKEQPPKPMKVCEKCGRTLPLTAFKRWKNKSAEGHEGTCKECKQLIKEGKKITTVQEATDAIANRKVAIEHATMYVQLAIQSLVTEAMLDYKAKIKAHPFFRQQAKRCLNEAEKHAELYDKRMVRHYSDETIEKLDDVSQAFLADVKDKRTQMFYALANHFAKANHPERHLITMVEYLFNVADIVKLYRNLFTEKFNHYGIPKHRLNAFEIDGALLKIDELARLCRKQYKYDNPEPHCEHLQQAMNNLCRVIDSFYKEQIEDTYKFYIGEIQ